MNVNNILAWITGNSRDTHSMKDRVQHGYDGTYSKHVMKYDELGAKFQTKAAEASWKG